MPDSNTLAFCQNIKYRVKKFYFIGGLISKIQFFPNKILPLKSSFSSSNVDTDADANVNADGRKAASSTLLSKGSGKNVASSKTNVIRFFCCSLLV